MTGYQESDLGGGAALSQAIQSDLVRWHGQLTAFGDSKINLHPAQFRVLVARCVQAVAEARKSALMVIEAAAELVEDEQPERATAALKSMAEALRDAPHVGRAN